LFVDTHKLILFVFDIQSTVSLELQDGLFAEAEIGTWSRRIPAATFGIATRLRITRVTTVDPIEGKFVRAQIYTLSKSAQHQTSQHHNYFIHR
jgi:hypothetical protein